MLSGVTSHEGLRRFGIMGADEAAAWAHPGGSEAIPGHRRPCSSKQLLLCHSYRSCNEHIPSSREVCCGKFAYFPVGDVLGSLDIGQFVTPCLLFFRHWVLSTNAFDGFLVLVAVTLSVWGRWPWKH